MFHFVKNLFSSKAKKSSFAEYINNTSAQMALRNEKKLWSHYAAKRFSNLISSVSYSVEKEQKVFENFHMVFRKWIYNYIYFGYSGLYIDQLNGYPIDLKNVNQKYFDDLEIYKYTEKYEKLREQDGIILLFDFDCSSEFAHNQDFLRYHHENSDLFLKLQNWHLKKGGRPFGSVTIPDFLNDEQRKILQQNLKQKGNFADDNYVLLEGNATAQFHDQEKYDNIFLKYLQSNRDLILIFHDYLPQILGNLSEFKEFKRFYYGFIVIPLLQNIEKLINQGFHKIGQQIGFKFDYSQLDYSYEDTYLITRICTNLERINKTTEDKEVREKVKEKMIKMLNLI